MPKAVAPQGTCWHGCQTLRPQAKLKAALLVSSLGITSCGPRSAPAPMAYGAYAPYPAYAAPGPNLYPPPAPSVMAGPTASAAPPPSPPALPLPVEGPAETPPFKQALPALAATSPATVHANLSPGECRKLLEERRLPFIRSKGAASGVATPMRISGPMHGVTFLTHPAPIPFGVLDCRLALTLETFAETVAAFGVVRVRIDNMYRKQAHLPGSRSKRSQHAYGLAVDIMSFTFEDGRTLAVENNWGAAQGTAPCGEDATIEPPSADAELMRNIICTVAQRGMFHHLLTPSYDAAHRNHYHLDIKRDGTRVSVR